MDSNFTTTKVTKDTKIMLTQVDGVTRAGGTGCNPVLPEATGNCQSKGTIWYFCFRPQLRWNCEQTCCFLLERNTVSFLLAALGPNCIRAYLGLGRIFLMLWVV